MLTIMIGVLFILIVLTALVILGALAEKTGHDKAEEMHRVQQRVRAYVERDVDQDPRNWRDS